MPDTIPMIWCAVHGSTGGNGCPKCLIPHRSNTVNICVVCKGVVDWDSVKEEFGELFEQVDCLGMESATEQEQVVMEGSCCSLECYIRMD